MSAAGIECGRLVAQFVLATIVVAGVFGLMFALWGPDGLLLN